MAFKMKGHTLPGIKQLKSNDLDDGRSGSAAFQQSDAAEKYKNAIMTGAGESASEYIPIDNNQEESSGGPFDQTEDKNITKIYKEDPPKKIRGTMITPAPEKTIVLPISASYTPPPVLGQKASWALGFADNPGEEEKSSD